MRTMRLHSRQRGTQLVEMAIVLPLLMVISLIIYEGGRMIRTHQVLNNAAREGARIAVLDHNKPDPNACDANCMAGLIQNEVIAYATNNGVSDLTAAEITVHQDCQIPRDGTAYVGCETTCSSGGGCFGATQVTIAYPYIFTFLPRWDSAHPTSITLGAAAEFRNLY